MFLNYQKGTGNDISETVKTNTFWTLIEMRSLNRNVRPPFQETPDQPLHIMIYDIIRATKQYFAPGPKKTSRRPWVMSQKDLAVIPYSARRRSIHIDRIVIY